MQFQLLNDQLPTPLVWKIALAVVLIGTLTITGCGGGPECYPVSGVVRLANGQPLAGGRVSFEAKNQSPGASGIVDREGWFSLNSSGQCHGAPPGDYRILIVPAGPPNDRTPAPQTIPARYRGYETSGLEARVECGPNEFEITLGDNAGKVVRKTPNAER